MFFADPEGRVFRRHDGPRKSSGERRLVSRGARPNNQQKCGTTPTAPTAMAFTPDLKGMYWTDSTGRITYLCGLRPRKRRAFRAARLETVFGIRRHARRHDDRHRRLHLVGVLGRILRAPLFARRRIDGNHRTASRKSFVADLWRTRLQRTFHHNCGRQRRKRKRGRNFVSRARRSGGQSRSFARKLIRVPPTNDKFLRRSTASRGSTPVM